MLLYSLYHNIHPTTTKTCLYFPSFSLFRCMLLNLQRLFAPGSVRKHKLISLRSCSGVSNCQSNCYLSEKEQGVVYCCWFLLFIFQCGVFQSAGAEWLACWQTTGWCCLFADLKGFLCKFSWNCGCTGMALIKESDLPILFPISNLLMSVLVFIMLFEGNLTLLLFYVLNVYCYRKAYVTERH